MLCTNLVVKQLYTDVQLLNSLFQKAYGNYVATENPQRIRTDKDVRGSMQQRCFCDAKTRVQKCTRRYTSGQAIFKRLTERLFYYVATVINARVSKIRLRFIFVRALYVQVKAPCSLQTKLVLCRWKFLCV